MAAKTLPGPHQRPLCLLPSGTGPGTPVPPSASTTAQEGPGWPSWHLCLGQEGMCTELKKAFSFQSIFSAKLLYNALISKWQCFCLL